MSGIVNISERIRKLQIDKNIPEILFKKQALARIGKFTFIDQNSAENLGNYGHFWP